MIGGASSTSECRLRRLRRRPDFLAAARGRRFHTDRLTAQGRMRASDEIREGVPVEGLHLGLTITKRVGHATERNRIRRRLHRAAALAATDMLALGVDVVVIARRPCLDAPFETLIDDLRRALAVVTKPRGPRSEPAPGTAEALASGNLPSRAAHVAAPTGGGEPRSDRRDGRAEPKTSTPRTNAPHGTSNG